MSQNFCVTVNFHHLTLALTESYTNVWEKLRHYYSIIPHGYERHFKLCIQPSCGIVLQQLDIMRLDDMQNVYILYLGKKSPFL